jgi:hypothetical protein
MLCGNSADSKGVFEIKRKVFRIVAGKKFDVLPLALESLLSILRSSWTTWTSLK